MAIGRARDNLDHSWPGPILFLLWVCCCVAMAEGANPKPRPGANDQISSIKQQLFRCEKGLGRLAQLGIQRVVFVTRLAYDDGHWYANIGYYCDDENQKAYAGNGKPDESKLYELDTGTGEIRVLLDGDGGSVRDPHVHYNGRRIVFSYRRA